jgi:hypothetical protein
LTLVLRIDEIYFDEPVDRLLATELSNKKNV